SAMAPCLLTRPKLGRRPVVPHTVDGETMDPRVSEPMANGRAPAATAAALPADEPLEPPRVSQGLRVMPPYHTSPQARAPSDSLAMSTAPAASSCSMTEASMSNCWSLNGFAPQVVGYPRTASRSLAP